MKKKSVNKSNEEYIIQVDEFDNFLWFKPRSAFQEFDLIHRSVWLWLYNSEGKILICKRQYNKKTNPWMWSHSVDWWIWTETNYSAIERETEEEIWIKWITFNYMYKYFHVKVWNTMWKIMYVWEYTWPISINKEEVIESKWVSRDWLKNDVLNNPKNYSESFIQSLWTFSEIIESWKFSFKNT